MTHIFSTGVNQMRHLTHLSQKYDTNERDDGSGSMPGPASFLAVRFETGLPTPPTSLYDFPNGNSPGQPRMFVLRT